MTLGQGQEMTLTLINYIPSLTPLVVCNFASSNFQVSGCNSFYKSIVSTFFHLKAYVSKIDLAAKKGQGHPRVIILANYDGLESTLLHIKFYGNLPTSSGEDFWRVFTVYGHGGHLGDVNKLPFPLPIQAPHKISTWSAKRFQRRRSLKLWTPTDGCRIPYRRTDAGAWVYYKLTCEPAFSSGELKICIPRHTPVFLYKSGVKGGIHCTDMFFFFNSV